MPTHMPIGSSNHQLMIVNHPSKLMTFTNDKITALPLALKEIEIISLYASKYLKFKIHNKYMFNFTLRNIPHTE